MLDHAKDLVRRVDCLPQNGDVASDSGGVFAPKRCEFRMYANESCGSRSIHEYCKLGFFCVWGERKWLTYLLLHLCIICIIYYISMWW